MWLFVELSRLDCVWLYSKDLMTVLYFVHFLLFISCRATFYKWKNHFSEMKGDVGMSLHEKEGEQEDAYTPSLHLCSFLMCSCSVVCGYW